jgi:hypothetical protein
MATGAAVNTLAYNDLFHSFPLRKRSDNHASETGGEACLKSLVTFRSYGVSSLITIPPPLKGEIRWGG